ncbi:hypothetical protein NN3_36620 [Nocardia neocaledoniensis NBRC 108232]|uniref:Excreted virulence factor EspC (Type VII ESX diderm) n=1 Tax=Nocardia neocaledoniensis TaxID=236511 RepID=A0A317NQU1_9NOCA|nr:hypothetical protein [Nocardia neocaledoniensis]PWV77630.1 hypothetical protein DFR69_103229 [Nocardia neocaledoniensis]GEM32655.1 hypothetical protein NN3_36620 [Nocardia neocaledoniensis NBRC 108232]
MGDTVSGGLKVDQGAMDRTISTLRDTVSTTRTSAKQVASLEWSAADAGRAYASSGQKIDAALDTVVGWAKIWTSASEGLADAIGTAVIEYTAVDTRTARGLDGVAPSPVK